MPINLLMKDIAIKTAHPDEQGNVPEYPVSITEVEDTGAVNSVSLTEEAAERLIIHLQGWMRIVHTMRNT